MTGLSLGLAASILLTTFILFELSFDKHFSEADRIYRLNSIWIEEGERSEMPINIREAYTEIPEKVPGIKSSVQIYRGFSREIIYDDNRHKDLSLLFADPEFFGLFDLEMLTGIAVRTLQEPNSVVITETVAARIYGDQNPMGQSFIMEEQVYTVTAVVKDIPPNTHFSFDMLLPMEMVPDLDGLGGLDGLGQDWRDWTGLDWTGLGTPCSHPWAGRQQPRVPMCSPGSLWSRGQGIAGASHCVPDQLMDASWGLG